MLLNSKGLLQVPYLVCVCICTYVKCSSNAGLSHPPSILCIGGLMSRSCMCWKVEAWKRRMVGSYLMDTHTPSPTPIICVISLFLRGCTMKAAYNMNRMVICMYYTINMHEGWCSPTIPLLSHKTLSLPTTEWPCQSDVRTLSYLVPNTVLRSYSVPRAKSIYYWYGSSA